MSPAVAADARADDRSPRTHLLLALLALTLGGFGIGVGEFVPMGLLPEIADGLDVSVTSAGHVVSAYALGVVVGAPLIAAYGATLPRRALLMGLMALFCAGNLLSAIAPSYGTLVGARFLTGLPHGAFFGVASLVAADMAGPHRRAWAITRVMLGLSVATVVGVPAVTWLGQNAGWRSTFVAVAVIAAASVVCVWRVVPRMPAGAEATVRRELAGLRSPVLWLTLGVATVGFGGLFAVYAYITPTMTERAGLDDAWMPLVLAAWGLGMVMANLVAGRFYDRSLTPSIYGFMAAFALVLALFPFLSTNPWSATLGVFLLGIGFALGPGIQTRLMDIAGEAQTIAAALNHAAFNAANALGPFLAGIAIDRGAGWTAPAWIGVAMVGGGAAIFTFSLAVDRRRAGREAETVPA